MIFGLNDSRLDDIFSQLLIGPVTIGRSTEGLEAVTPWSTRFPLKIWLVPAYEKLEKLKKNCGTKRSRDIFFYKVVEHLNLEKIAKHGTSFPFIVFIF